MRHTVRLIFFLLLVLVFASCTKQKNSGEVITIYVPKTLAAIPVLELKGKLVADKTVNVEFFQDHVVIMAELLHGDFSLLMTGFTQGVKTAASSNKLMQVTCSVWGVSSLITNRKEIHALEDLKEKKVLVPFRGSPMELQLKVFLKHAGIEKNVLLEYAPIQQMVPLLMKNRADAISLPEPLASKLVLEKNCTRVFTYAEAWSRLSGGDKRSPQVALFCKSGFAERNKEFLTELLISLKRTTLSVNSNHASVAAKYASVFDLDESIIEEGLNYIVLEVPEASVVKQLCEKYISEIDLNVHPDNSFYFGAQ